MRIAIPLLLFMNLTLASCGSNDAPASLIALEQMGSASAEKKSMGFEHRSVVNVSGLGVNNFVGLVSGIANNSELADAHGVQLAIGSEKSYIQEMKLNTNAEQHDVAELARLFKKLNRLIVEKTVLQFNDLQLQLKQLSGTAKESDAATKEKEKTASDAAKTNETPKRTIEIVQKDIKRITEKFETKMRQHHNVFITRWTSMKGDAFGVNTKSGEDSSGFDYDRQSKERLSGIAILAGIRKTNLIFGEDLICEGKKASSESFFKLADIYIPIHQLQAQHISFVEDAEIEQMIRAALNVSGKDIVDILKIKEVTDPVQKINAINVLIEKIKLEISYSQIKLLSTGLQANVSSPTYARYDYSFNPEEQFDYNEQEMNRSQSYIGFYAAQISRKELFMSPFLESFSLWAWERKCKKMGF
jgi:hypothetical protein